MNGIEKYIKENIDEFDAAPVPEGSRKAFLQKVKAQTHRRRTRTIMLAVPSVAAAVLIILSLIPRDGSNEIKRYHRRLAVKEMIIMAKVSKTAPESLEDIVNTIRVVTSEVIPLEDQLSDVMEEGAKKRILKEYYDCKDRALEQILDQYTE